MIKVGVDVNFMNEYGDILLIVVLDYGYFEVVKKLINVGVDGCLSDEILICLMKLFEKWYFEIYYEDLKSYRKYW